VLKYAIRHIPSGMYYNGHDWTFNVIVAALYDRFAQALDALGQAECAGKANAPPYEIVPMAPQYAPTGSPVKYP
jgi:hypothetical protein